MSTDIKPGQVWAATADHEETYTVREVRDGDVWSTNRYGGHTVNRADLFRQGRTLLTEATPAPLDPSKVKAGDTATVEVITVEDDKFSIEGTVRGEGFDLWLGPVCITLPHEIIKRVTLTDHQPAPEPEPEWKPGTVGTAAVKGRFGRVRVMRLHECPTDKTHHWVEESGLIPDDSHVTDVRPLVVIDPAAVDVDALAAAIRKAEETGGPFTATTQRLAYAALAHLGIEVAS